MLSKLKVWLQTLLGHSLGRVCILLLLVLLIYARGLSYDAINWDDPHYGPQGAQVSDGFTPDNLMEAWGPSQPQTPTWHPLTWWSLALDRSLYGNWAGGFRLTALLIHFLNALLVLRLAGMWGLSPVPGLFSACLFVCHPLQVESVIWISERKGILAGTGALAAVLWWTVYIRTNSARAYWASLGCFVLSLLCKQMALALPGILLVLEIWPLQRSEPLSLLARVLRWVRELSPFAIVSIVFAAVAVIGQAQSAAIRPVSEVSISSRFATATVVTARLARRVVWPDDLCLFDPLPQQAFSLLTVMASVAVIVTWLAAGVLLYRRAPHLLAMSLWFMLALVPVNGLVQLADKLTADRYVYFPIVGLGMSLACLLDSLHGAPMAARFRALTNLLPLAILVLMTGCSLLLVQSWRSSVDVWERALKVHPPATTSIVHYAEALDQAGRAPDAIRVLVDYTKQRPADQSALVSLAAISVNGGQLDVALPAWRKLCQTQPSFANWFQLGQTAVDLGLFAEGEAAFGECVKLNPQSAAAWNNRGIALMLLSRPRDAIECFRAAVQAEPGMVDARRNLARAIEELNSNQR